MIAALIQAWPPFVLVSGLVLIGLVADRDGVFDAAAKALNKLPGSPLALFAACRATVAVTTALLNLDTAAVLLTPAPLSSAPVAHPAALLIGLDIGPNLAVSGSLSALLWWRSAKATGADPSALECSRQGVMLAPLAIVAALAAGVAAGTLR